MPSIICEENEEEEMASNLRVEFYKRQRKGLFESIVIDLSLSKKTHSTPGPDSPSKPTSPTLIIVVASSPDEKPSSVDDISYHEMRKPFVVTGNISEDSFECSNSSYFRLKPTYVSSREEMFEFLSHIISFTKKKPPM